MSAKNSCDIVDLATINPENIVFHLEFDSFWLDTQEGGEECGEDDEGPFSREDEDDYGWLWGDGGGSIFIVSDHGEDDFDLDDAIKVADLDFTMSPDEQAKVTITKTYGNFKNLDEIVNEWNSTNETEFLGGEIDGLILYGEGHISDSTLKKAYVG